MHDPNKDDIFQLAVRNKRIQEILNVFNDHFLIFVIKIPRIHVPTPIAI
ncbi:hypothetical protein R5R51_06190 [Oenococcus oeni]|nr:hypothetical protein [Oenococcus oeni]KZD13224.1 hypothetical protein AC229_0716 [Oenococcus oeni]